MKTKLALVAVGLLVFCAWTRRQQGEIRKAEWLIGTWEHRTPGGSVYETWRKISGDEFFGKSYVLKEQDTIVSETIRLVQKEGKLFYIPTVKNQNEGLPVLFALKAISGTALVFNNPAHDFPQTISYTKINADSLVAKIAGTKNGQERKQAFPMRRVK